VAIGSLLALLAAADAISGERERGTLETLLLAPISRRSLVIGKGVAALTLWGCRLRRGGSICLVPGPVASEWSGRRC